MSPSVVAKLIAGEVDAAIVLSQRFSLLIKMFFAKFAFLTLWQPQRNIQSELLRTAKI